MSSISHPESTQTSISHYPRSSKDFNKRTSCSLKNQNHYEIPYLNKLIRTYLPLSPDAWPYHRHLESSQKCNPRPYWLRKDRWSWKMTQCQNQLPSKLSNHATTNNQHNFIRPTWNLYRTINPTPLRNPRGIRSQSRKRILNDLKSRTLNDLRSRTL